MADLEALLIYGGSGFGRELAAWAGRAAWGDRPVRVLGLIDDFAQEEVVNGLPVWRLDDAARLHEGAFFVAAVGRPQLREQLVTQAETAGLRAAPPTIHPSVDYDRERVTIGDGSVICPGTTLTTNI